MRRIRCVVMLACTFGVLLAGPGCAVAPQEPATTHTEFLRLRTADGRENAGLLHAPIGRTPRGGLVLIHGYGGNFYSGAQAHLSRQLTVHGFVTLATNMRDHDRGPKTTRFEDNRWDLQAAVDELTRRGVAPLVIIGESLGTNHVLYYLAATRDQRIHATLLIAGPGNAFEWNVRQFGSARATRVLEEARGLRAVGRGKELMVVDLGPLGKALYSADHLVSLRGPQTKSDPYRNIAEVTVPILLVYGTADRRVDVEVGRRLKAAATRTVRTDLVEIRGADHGFSRHRDALTATVSRWLVEVLGR